MVVVIIIHEVITINKILILKNINVSLKWSNIGWNEANIKLPSIPSIYKLTIEGKPYIGMTSNINRRYKQHINDAKSSSSKVLHRFMRHSLSKGSFEFEVLAFFGTTIAQKRLESKLIVEYNSFLDGWNQTIGGELPSQTLSKYIDDYLLAKNPQLFDLLEWKLEWNDMPWSVKFRLTNKLGQKREYEYDLGKRKRFKNE